MGRENEADLNDGVVLCDTYAIAIALDENIIKESDMVHVDVELKGELTRGMTVVDFKHSYCPDTHKRKRTVEWVKSIDYDKFYKMFKS